MAAGGVHKRPDNSYQSAADNRISNLGDASAPHEKGSAGNASGTNEGIGLAATGSVTPGSSGLFAQVADVSIGQEIPRMVVSQRSYEAYAKTALTGEEAYALDTFA